MTKTIYFNSKEYKVVVENAKEEGLEVYDFLKRKALEKKNAHLESIEKKVGDLQSRFTQLESLITKKGV